MKEKQGISGTLRNSVITALMVAPTLAVLMISAVNYWASGALGQDVDGFFPLVLASLTLLSLAASTVLAVVYKKKYVTLLLSVIFTLCFICYMVFLLNGNTDLYGDAFFEKLMLALSLPVSSYLSIGVKIFEGGANVAALVITGIIALTNIICSVIIHRTEK